MSIRTAELMLSGDGAELAKISKPYATAAATIRDTVGDKWDICFLVVAFEEVCRELARREAVDREAESK